MSEELKLPTSDPRISVTSMEPVDHKAAVEPYDESPFVELRPRVLACEYCGHGRFRRSRIRFLDLFYVLGLRYPVRCTRCSQRQYQELTLAMLSTAPKSHGSRVAEGVESWQNWTKSSPGTPLSTRPMSTALGTRAQRLPETASNSRSAPPSRIPPRHNSENDIW